MEKKIEKNEEYIVTIIDNGFEGEGIAKINDFTVFVPGTIKGEKVRIWIVKVLTSYAFAKVLEILEQSNDRIEIDCETYKRCGGCDLRHMQYETTLELKQKSIENLVKKSLEQDVKVEKVIGMGNPIGYRNKAQYPIGMDTNKKAAFGVFANRSHEIIPIQHCWLQNQISEQIAKTIVDFINQNNISVYNEHTHKGLVRHIVIRIGIQTQQIMCVIVLNGKQLPKEEEFVKELIAKFPQIETIIKNVNMQNTNVILGSMNIPIYGEGYIYDRLGDFTFKISPASFYQVNPIQAELLYHIAVDEAELSKQDIALDLYCGIGTITSFVAQRVKKVYGVEIVQQAIEDAKENAKLNNLKNIEFINGDVEKIWEYLLKQSEVIPNIIFVDPPRKGLDNTSITAILNALPRKLVYISCNPATLIRDLSKLEHKYEISKIIPVDMFPYTHHCEVVSVLQLK